MNKIIHISRYRRFSPLGIHTGGIAKFAWYLQKAIQDLVLFSWDMFPDWQEYELHTPDWEKARFLNEWLVKEGIVDEETTAIVDGYWGLGLEGKVKRLISVCHGSYAGAMVEHFKNPWSDGLLLGQNVYQQETFWKESGCEVVAVSRNAARELKLLCGLNSTVIENGIDLSIFGKYAKLDIPHSPERPLVLEVTEGMPAKGSEIVAQLKEMGYRIEPFGVKTGNLDDEAARWVDAEIALFPSRYEGGPYAWLEAMACGCKIVAYWTGFAPDLAWPFSTDDYHVKSFAHLLDVALEASSRVRYAAEMETHSFDTFARKWRTYLEV